MPRKETCEYFDRLYEREKDVPSWGVGADRMLVQNLPVLERRNVAIDLGCGDGRNTLFLARFGGFKKLIALDASKGGILKMLRFAKELHLTGKIETVVSDMCKLNLGIDRYSLVVAAISLSFMRKQDSLKMISKIKKAVEPGGGVFVSALNVLDPNFREIPKGHYHSFEMGCYTCYYELGELRDLFSEDSNFIVIDYVDNYVLVDHIEKRWVGISAVFAKKPISAHTKKENF